MSIVMVVAPHPDDETLGCGGTLLKHIARKDEVHWLICTQMQENNGFSKERINRRNEEINRVKESYSFQSSTQLKFCTTNLDMIPLTNIITEISNVFKEVQPEIIYLPYRGDVHTDHAVVFDAVISCTKWFRYPFVKKVLAYETLSETDFGVNPDLNGFRPNVFVDISSYIDKKIEIMKIFEDEIGEFPFPRSEQAIRSLAHVRGAASGYPVAEAFMLLKERC